MNSFRVCASHYRTQCTPSHLLVTLVSMLSVCAGVASLFHCVRNSGSAGPPMPICTGYGDSFENNSSLRQESNNGPGMTQSELMQGQSLQLLFDGFTRCDQTAIHCQRLTHSDSIRNCRHARAVIAHWALKSCWFHRCIVSRRDEHYDSRA